MVVLRETVTDDDAMAMRDVPDGWLAVVACGWWWVGRVCDLSGEEGFPLGPFQSARDAADAADREERRTRQEDDR
jgi:hypothetical protein